MTIYVSLYLLRVVFVYYALGSRSKRMKSKINECICMKKADFETFVMSYIEKILTLIIVRKNLCRYLQNRSKKRSTERRKIPYIHHKSFVSSIT